jgi:hypothetical protein
MNKRLGENLVEPLTSLMPDFPTEGIAYRGDPIRYAGGSLQRASGNYIVFTPNENDPVEELATELQQGVNFALQFSYPEQWGENPANPINGQFEGYTAHYSENPHDLPVLSWGTTSHLGQLAAVQAAGRCFYTRDARITVGSVRVDGPIAPSHIREPIVATLEDIHQIESSIDQPRNPDQKFRWPTRKHRPPTFAEYLGGIGRVEFHSGLGNLMAARLLSAIKNEIEIS